MVEAGAEVPPESFYAARAALDARTGPCRGLEVHRWDGWGKGEPRVPVDASALEGTGWTGFR